MMNNIIKRQNLSVGSRADSNRTMLSQVKPPLSMQHLNSFLAIFFSLYACDGIINQMRN